MLKQGLELKQTQKLSPLQIQTIKLIELPIQELEQKVKSELEDNPVLDDSPAPERTRTMMSLRTSPSMRSTRTIRFPRTSFM